MNEFSTKKKLFGGEIEIVIKNTEKELFEIAVEESYSLGLELQKIFNFFDAKSELSRLNKKRKLKASRDLLELIKFSLKVCELSSGFYDISLGKKILQRKLGLDEKDVECSYKDILINGDVVELAHPDVMLDLGSVAKGYIADKMIELLQEMGIKQGLLDARGDIRVFGQKEEIIDIQHPRKKSKTLGAVKIKNMSIATSGDYNQYTQTYARSHLINKTDLISVTAIAKNLKDADIYATALAVSPPRVREKIIRSVPNIAFLTINKNLKPRFYNNFNKFLHEKWK
ncbi:FAD:protein FMN transferase [Candidatus Pacearchaeota archaeon]|nr:MAG: FAD:protein FMN transferase [Candidatus Pacearchaeota archaeon]